MDDYDTSKVAHAIFIGIWKDFDIEMKEEQKSVSGLVYYTMVRWGYFVVYIKKI